MLRSWFYYLLFQGEVASNIPSPLRGRARVGVKGWQAAEVAFESANPHPNLPPVRGKEFKRKDLI